MPKKSTAPRTIPQLGDLEVAVLEHVWRLREATVKDAHAELGAPRGISLNTVQSAMERLFRKGLLTRVKVSHAYAYSASLRREEVVATLIGEVVGRFGSDSSAALAAFVGVADDLDENALRALEAEIRKRRQSGRSK